MNLQCVCVLEGLTMGPTGSESAQENVAGEGERERHRQRKTTQALPNLSSGTLGDN